MNIKNTKHQIFSFLLLFVLFSQVSLAQSIIQNQMPKKDGVKATLTEIQEKFNEKWRDYEIENGFIVDNGVKQKAANWKVFKRWEWFWEQRVNLETGEFPATNAAAEYIEYKNKLKKENAYNENWTNLGTSSSSGGYAGIGRVNCIAFHPADVNSFWIGSPSGGIWRTTDGGSSWTILNNNETVLGVSDIAVNSDYATSQTIYIATGDRDGGSMWSLNGGQGADNVSVGIYKSTDAGATWTATGLVFAKSQGAKIYRLLIHPSNNSTLLASTSSGIYKSTDGGVNWTLKSPNLWVDMEFKPTDPNTIYASSIGYGDAYFNVSTDGGENWSFYQVAAGGYRGEIAVTADNSSVVYMLIANGSGGLVDVYKSTNSGTSFSALGANSKSMLGYYSDGSGSNTGQGTYDLCIAASPSDENTVYIGGVNTWKSTDGGSTWTINNMWTGYSGYNKSGAPVVHADKHALAFQSSGVLFEGNDGGIYKTTNGGVSWTDLSDGLIISQLYRIGVSQTSANTVLTGLQDNGSKLYSGGSWSDVKGGDGMECIIDYSNSNYMYATYVRGQITRSENGFTNWTTEVDISANIPGGQPTGAWVTPYIIDMNNSSTLYGGYDKVWKTTDRGDSWTSISQVLSSSDKLRSLAIAPSNSNILYAADRGNMWKTTDGGATNWSTITLPSTSTSVTYITVHPTDPNTLWITYGGYVAGQKVYESTNGGASWTSISNGLPNLPVMCIVHYNEATDRNVLFAGTDLGVYVKDGANDWEQYNTGLPSVVVTELEIYYNPVGTDKLRAGTYGRGLWETEIDAVLPVELTSFAANILKDENVLLEWETATEINNYGFEIERQHQLSQNGNPDWEKIGFVEGRGNSNSPNLYSFTDNMLSGGNKFEYRLKQVDINGRFEYSDIVEINIVPEEYEIDQNYPNPFNPATRINYKIPSRSHIKLSVYNVLGKEIVRLIDEPKEAGFYTVQFDGSALPSGVYYYTLNGRDFSKTRKMMLIK